MLKLMYEKCKANVYVSLYEGFGFPPFEAALNDKISIVSNIGALPEIYNNAAYFVNPSSVREIGEALQNVASVNFDEKKYTKHFSELFARYTWQKTASEIRELICREVKCHSN